MRFLNRAYSWCIFNGYHWRLIRMTRSAGFGCHDIPYSTRLINAPKRAGISSSLWILFKSFSSIQFFLYSLSPWNMRFTLNCLDLGDHLSSTYIYMLRKNKGQHQIWSYSFWCKYAGDPSSIWEHCHVDWCRPALLLAKCGRKKTDERGRSTGCRDKLTTVSSVQPYLFLVLFFSPLFCERGCIDPDATRKKLFNFSLPLWLPRQFHWIKTNQLEERRTFKLQPIFTFLLFFYSNVRLITFPIRFPHLFPPVPPSHRKSRAIAILLFSYRFLFSFSTRMFNGSALINSTHTLRKVRKKKTHTQ